MLKGSMAGKFSTALKMRVNVVPATEALTRGRAGLHRKCSRCRGCLEMLYHMMGACKKLSSTQQAVQMPGHDGRQAELDSALRASP